MNAFEKRNDVHSHLQCLDELLVGQLDRGTGTGHVLKALLAVDGFE